MSRYNPNRNVGPVLAAAEQWINRCLIDQRSLFSERALWTLPILEQVKEAFTDNPDSGDTSFSSKLERQMQPASADAQCLMAELLWVLMLFQSNIGAAKKRDTVQRVWGWSGIPLVLSHPLLADDALVGIGSPGTAYNTGRWRELNYLIGLAIDLAKRSGDERASILRDRAHFEQWILDAPHEGYRQFRHLFRYLAFPDYNERITLNRDRRLILEAFTDMDPGAINDMSDAEQDDALNALRKRLQVQNATADLDFYEPQIKEQWRTRADAAPPQGVPTSPFALGYAELRDRFLTKFPNFTDFASAADYVADEREYKDELLRLFADGVAPLLANADWTAAGTAAFDLLTKPLKTASNRPQNIVGWRYVDLLRQLDPVQRSAFAQALGDLVDETRPLELRVDTFVGHFLKIVGVSKRVLPAAQRSIVGFYLALAHPDRHMFMKTAEMQRALRRLDPSFGWTSHRLPGADVLRVEELARKVFERLVGEGWRPKDFLDVQGFLWVAANQDGKSVEDNAEDSEEIEAMADKPTRTSRPALNQILFGPPGTGKTYHSVNAALDVLDPACLAANPGAKGRRALKKRFDELVQARRIRFVTFHQSFSYEDFVEGLRADNDEDGNLRYRVEPGVFKSICDDARGAAQVASAIGIRDGARIWKISIEGTGASTTRDHCFKNGEARIGWGEVGDLHDEHMAEQPAYAALGSNDRNTLHAFSIDIQPGDVMLCIGSTTQAQAIGVVQGDYRFDARVTSGVRTDFTNVLPVRWLATGLALNLRELNGGIRFTLKTVYELSRFSWPELAEAIEAAGIELDGARSLAIQPLDHVLIIDEINRGNVSRIFGELITLIEPSKRAGADEQLEVVLPYSKKSFAVPANVHLICTMNTADRSLAGLDIALRRRFEFVEMPARPEFLADIFVEGIDIEAMLSVMNQRIEVLLDRDHHLGHAYFMPLIADQSLTRLAAIFRSQILPLLQEYFFEDWERIRWVLNDQHKKTAGHCFVVAPTHSVPGLFGSTAEVPVDARLWELAPAALGRRESYLGIIDANGV